MAQGTPVREDDGFVRGTTAGRRTGLPSFARILGFVTYLVLGLLICPALRHVRAEAQPTCIYTVEGQLHCTLPEGGEQDETFVVAVSNSTWSIQITIPERPAFRSFDQVYNGDVLSSLTRFATNIVLNQTNRTRRKLLNNDSVATIERTDVPNNKIGTYAGQLWLACTSYRSFQDNRDGLEWPLDKAYIS